MIITSFVLNGLAFVYIVGGYLLQPIIEDQLLVANANAYQKYYCETKYDAMLHKHDELPDSQRDAQKMLYAMTFCLRNYKNGEQLNLQPLLDEINKTDPKTDYKAN